MGIENNIYENIIDLLNEINEELLENIIGITKHPSILIFGEIDGFGISILSTIQSEWDIDSIIVELLGSIDQYQILLENAKKSKPPPSQRQILMQEQNKAYEESLKRDREIEKEKEMLKLQQQMEEIKIQEEKQKQIEKKRK